MIYLYVKTHTTTGLKYLGKTTRKNYHAYKGSGIRWLRHLEVHGATYTTEILLATESKAEFKETSLFFSKLWNIVESNDWANLRVEEGDGGDTARFSDYVKNGRSNSRTRNSEDWILNRRDSISQKLSASVAKTKADPLWRATVGKSVSDEAKRRQNDPAWRALHFKPCPICSRELSPGNFGPHYRKCSKP